jgi:hypothetical protein
VGIAADGNDAVLRGNMYSTQLVLRNYEDLKKFEAAMPRA